MEITPQHRDGAIAPTTVDDYLAAVEKTTSFNEGHLHFAHDRGTRFNADSPYAAIGSSPGDDHAEVEIDGRYLPKDLRAIAFGLLVHADALEGR